MPTSSGFVTEHGFCEKPPVKFIEESEKQNQKSQSSDILLSHPPKIAEDGAPTSWKSLTNN